MQNVGINPSRFGLELQGIQQANTVYWNLPAATLYEHAIRRQEGLVAQAGSLIVTTGHHTGRSPDDKFIVRESSSEYKVWWGKVNRPFDPDKFDLLYRNLLAFIQTKDLYVQDCFAGADPAYRIPIRVISEAAWHSLFARNMFIRPKDGDTGEHVPEFTIISAPGFHAVIRPSRSIR